MKSLFAAMLLMTAAFLSGCATAYREPPPAVMTPPPALTLAQIKEMTIKGVSDETILNALRASRAVYKLTSKDVLELQEAKVSPAVIDYLLSTAQFRPPPPAPRYRANYYYYPPPYWYSWGWGWHHDFGFHDFHHHGHH